MFHPPNSEISSFVVVVFSDPKIIVVVFDFEIVRNNFDFLCSLKDEELIGPTLC